MKIHGQVELCYNGQCATENQVILAYDVNSKEVDKDQLVPMIEELESVTKFLNGKAEYPLKSSKVLTDAGYDSNRAKIDRKLQTKTGKNIFSKRKTDVEQTFGQIKTTILGQTGFLVRGSENVKGEFGLTCIVHNIKKIITYLKSKENSKDISTIYRFA
jgi:hypothetical protein